MIASSGGKLFRLLEHGDGYSNNCASELILPRVHSSSPCRYPTKRKKREGKKRGYYISIFEENTSIKLIKKFLLPRIKAFSARVLKQ
jgi:hypothetical protein